MFFFYGGYANGRTRGDRESRAKRRGKKRTSKGKTEEATRKDGISLGLSTPSRLFQGSINHDITALVRELGSSLPHNTYTTSKYSSTKYCKSSIVQYSAVPSCRLSIVRYRRYNASAAASLSVGFELLSDSGVGFGCGVSVVLCGGLDPERAHLWLL